MAAKGKLRRLIQSADLEGVIQHCWSEGSNTHEALEEYRQLNGVSVEDTDRARNRLSRRKQYKEGHAQDYVRRRYRTYDYTKKPARVNANGTRKWDKNEYLQFLKLQEKGSSEVEIAQSLATNLIMVKYLRTKRKLAMQILSKKKLPVEKKKIVQLMEHGETTLKSILAGKKRE